MPSCIHLFDSFKWLTLNFEMNDSETRPSQLRQGIAQFVIVSPEQIANEMDSKILRPDNYVLVGPRGWKIGKF